MIYICFNILNIVASPPVKVFLTYANGVSEEEENLILKDVRQLVKTLQINNFDVSFDSLQQGDDNAKRQVYQQFKQVHSLLEYFTNSWFYFDHLNVLFNMVSKNNVSWIVLYNMESNYKNFSV